MADKNVKAELNAENLEGVAGGAAVEIRDIDKHSKEHVDIRAGIEDMDMRNPWHEDDEPSVANPPKDDGKKSESNKGKIKF